MQEDSTEQHLPNRVSILRAGWASRQHPSDDLSLVEHPLPSIISISGLASVVLDIDEPSS